MKVENNIIFDSLKKKDVESKLKRMLEAKKVCPVLVSPKNSKKDVVAFVLNEHMFVGPDYQYPGGHYIFKDTVLCPNNNGEYSSISPGLIQKELSAISFDMVKLQKGLKDIGINLPLSDIVDTKLLRQILENAGKDENEIEAIMKAMDNMERQKTVERDNIINSIDVPVASAVYLDNELVRPYEDGARAKSGDIYPVYKEQNSLSPYKVIDESHVEVLPIVVTVTIITDRLYEDGHDFVTVDELQNIANTARYLDEDQKAAAQYMADLMSEANLDNLSLEQLRDYANDVEVEASVKLTDVSVEKENELFDKINNAEAKPLMPSDIDFGDAYSEERTRNGDDYNA